MLTKKNSDRVFANLSFNKEKKMLHAWPKDLIIGDRKKKKKKKENLVNISSPETKELLGRMESSKKTQKSPSLTSQLIQ